VEVTTLFVAVSEYSFIMASIHPWAEDSYVMTQKYAPADAANDQQYESSYLSDNSCNSDNYITSDSDGNVSDTEMENPTMNVQSFSVISVGY
jgi:hypothetical protein